MSSEYKRPTPADIIAAAAAASELVGMIQRAGGHDSASRGRGASRQHGS
jgi:hypothetical protein